MAAPDRRLFLKYLGAGLTGAAASFPGLGPIAEARGAMPFGAATARACPSRRLSRRWPMRWCFLHMWVITDIKSNTLNRDAQYTAFRNNGMFFVPTSGPEAGRAFQFASGPCESELTGPSWTPDESTLFLSVQHPGSAYGMRTHAVAPPRGSNWPDGRLGAPPRPGVVAIRKG